MPPVSPGERFAKCDTLELCMKMLMAAGLRRVRGSLSAPFPQTLSRSKRGWKGKGQGKMRQKERKWEKKGRGRRKEGKGGN